MSTGAKIGAGFALPLDQTILIRCVWQGIPSRWSPKRQPQAARGDPLDGMSLGRNLIICGLLEMFWRAPTHQIGRIRSTIPSLWQGTFLEAPQPYWASQACASKSLVTGKSAEVRGARSYDGTPARCQRNPAGLRH